MVSMENKTLERELVRCKKELAEIKGILAFMKKADNVIGVKVDEDERDQLKDNKKRLEADIQMIEDIA